MSFPFVIDGTIPATNDDPADDQPIMKSNFANTSGFLAVDHVAPGTNPGAAFHKRITYFGNQTPTPPSNTGPITCAYTVTGVADNTHNQNVWQNTLGVFPLSAIRAFGTFLTQAPVALAPFLLTPTVPVSTYNVVSISEQNAGIYIITFPPGIIKDTPSVPTCLVTVSPKTQTNANLPRQSFVGDTLTLSAVSQNDLGTRISFVVLQF